jgi:small-conductance mechanosensitive channel
MPTLFTTDSIETLRRNIVAALPNIAGGVVVIVVFWLLALVTHWIVCRVSTGKRIEPALVWLMGKVAYIGLIVTGLIMGLGTMGVNVSALVAGLGLTGFAVGFALKDIISNLLAGVLVILYQTFGEGDRIKVAGFEGKVQRIDLRYTLLDTGSEVVFLPNQLLFNNPVVVVRTEPGGVSEAAAAVPN